MNNSKVILIAEIGENYLGKINLAKKLIVMLNFNLIMKIV